MIRRFDMSQMVINIMGLCIFPFICEPILKDVFATLGNHESFDGFIEKRKRIVSEMITLWLQKTDA